MKLYKLVVLVVLCIVYAVSSASTWRHLGESNIASVWIGEGKFSTAQIRNDIYISAFRAAMSDGRVILERRYLKVAECRTGFGSLITVDDNGLPTFIHQFQLSGQKLGDIAAKAMCQEIQNKTSK